MTDIAQTFLSESRRLLSADYLPKIESCVAELSAEEIWWRPNEASNSAGNLVLHLCGNLRQWVIGEIGGRQFTRERQREFDEHTPVPTRELLTALRSVVSEADEVIGSLDEEALSRRNQIQGRERSVLEAVYHVVEHFGMHTGQIIFLSKMRAGKDLGLWRPRNLTTP
jgi:uncharacterized damage-inducible protein DinB